MHKYLQQMVTSDSVGPPALNAQNIHDTEAPNAPVLDPIISPTNQKTIIVTGTSEADATVEILTDGTSAETGLVDADGRFSIAIDLAEGENTIAARATDSLNNGPGPQSLSQKVVLDTIAPSAPVLDSMASPTVSPSQMVTGTSEPSSYVEVFINGEFADWDTADDTGMFSVDIVLTEGVNVIRARATDMLGNGPGDYSNSLVVTLDTTAPEAPVITQLPASTENERSMVTGVSEPDAVVEVFLNGLSLGTIVADDNGEFEVEVSLIDGDNYIIARATDALGNGPGELSTPAWITYSPVSTDNGVDNPAGPYQPWYIVLIALIILAIIAAVLVYFSRDRRF